MKKLITAVILGSTLTAFFYSCSKKERIICAADPVSTYGAFRIVDQSTGTDLFFADHPKYSLKDIYAFKTKDLARHDTIRPIVFGKKETIQAFILPLNFTKSRDTLILKIANTAEDKFIYTTKKATSQCSLNELDKIYLNNIEATYLKDQNVYILKKP
ncbi:hypothetical protein [Pedobacter nutrimenti]|uniref:Lipoprotein n=1 Tax=Pedobacter nutrimenti TaxID=1241337 RepID=A0A318UFF1_9SPHI|nr:hypothetical protein [Pedobacter nutrimenti]PYF75122.1 hypothetical protein B0O44_103571 [Pedobacter nutrimenti]